MATKRTSNLERDIQAVVQGRARRRRLARDAEPASPRKSAIVRVYRGASGYWYAQASNASTGMQIIDASGYSRENALNELRRKSAMIGVAISSVIDENPYVSG